MSGYKSWEESRRASVTLDWSTASEFDTIGYNIYRSDNLDGEYVRVNLNIIPVAQDSLIGSEYTYRDTDVIPGLVYYYELEDVNMDGQASRSSPIVVEARSKYWDYLLLFFMFVGITILLVVNRRWFNNVAMLAR